MAAAAPGFTVIETSELQILRQRIAKLELQVDWLMREKRESFRVRRNFCASSAIKALSIFRRHTTKCLANIIHSLQDTPFILLLLVLLLLRPIILLVVVDNRRQFHSR